MEKTTIIDKIKELFNEDVVVDAKFLDVKDSEGNILRVSGEELTVGSELYLITEAGEELTGAGEYLLEDGRTIVVDEASLITEVVEAEAAPEEEAVVVEEEMNDEVSIDSPTMEDKMDAKIKEKMVELDDKLNDVLSKFSAINEKLIAISGEPAEEEIKIEKVGFQSANKPSSTLDELGKFRK